MCLSMDEHDNKSLEPNCDWEMGKIYLKKSIRVMSRYLVVHGFINE